MRVPRSISVVRGTEISFLRKSSFFCAKIDFPGIFAHDQTAPAEGRHAFFPGGGRAKLGPRSSQPEAGNSFGNFWGGPGRGPWRGNFLSVVPPPCIDRGCKQKRRRHIDMQDMQDCTEKYFSNRNFTFSKDEKWPRNGFPEPKFRR